MKQRIFSLFGVLIILGMFFSHCLVTVKAYDPYANQYDFLNDIYLVEDDDDSSAASAIPALLTTTLIASGVATVAGLGVTAGYVWKNWDKVTQDEMKQQVIEDKWTFRTGAIEASADAWNWVLGKIRNILGTESGTMTFGNFELVHYDRTGYNSAYGESLPDLVAISANNNWNAVLKFGTTTATYEYNTVTKYLYVTYVTEFGHSYVYRYVYQNSNITNIVFKKQAAEYQNNDLNYPVIGVYQWAVMNFSSYPYKVVLNTLY